MTVNFTRPHRPCLAYPQCRVTIVILALPYVSRPAPAVSQRSPDKIARYACAGSSLGRAIQCQHTTTKAITTGGSTVRFSTPHPAVA